MSRTYSKGRKNFKRKDCGKGHLNCSYCGWDKGWDNYRRTIKKKILKFELLQYYIEEV